MDERILLGFMLRQNGLATLHEVLTHFEEVATTELLGCWDMLKAKQKIGILLRDGVFLLRGGVVVYSITRTPDPRWTILYEESYPRRRGRR
jgi:hypothetical protein